MPGRAVAAVGAPAEPGLALAVVDALALADAGDALPVLADVEAATLAGPAFAAAGAVPDLALAPALDEASGACQVGEAAAGFPAAWALVPAVAGA